MSCAVLLQYATRNIHSPMYMQEDTLVRALRFMDTLLQRDNLQKAAFLKDLTSFWTRFDSRILCYKVSARPCSVHKRCNVDVAVVSWPFSMLQCRLMPCCCENH